MNEHAIVFSDEKLLQGKINLKGCLNSLVNIYINSHFKFNEFGIYIFGISIFL